MQTRDLTCESCGKAFVCGEGGRDGGCWCMDLPPVLALPREENTDCLCPDCMEIRINTIDSSNTAREHPSEK